MLVCLTACTAPQGKKVAMNEGLPPVATGPSSEVTPMVPSSPVTQVSTVTYDNRDSTIGLHPARTITVTLPSYNRNGYEWRLSEIPDPSVLKMVSNDRTPGPTLAQPGEQTMVFEATGTGMVPVKMWYGTLWASRMEENRPFEFIASVTPEPPKPAAKKKSTKSKSKSKKTTEKVAAQKTT
jgi:predicted secreted protein